LLITPVTIFHQTSSAHVLTQSDVVSGAHRRSMADAMRDAVPQDACCELLPLYGQHVTIRIQKPPERMTTTSCATTPSAKAAQFAAVIQNECESLLPSRRRCQSAGLSLQLAFHSYMSVHRRLPFHAYRDQAPTYATRVYVAR